jgi:hypothetical protein
MKAHVMSLRKAGVTSDRILALNEPVMGTFGCHDWAGCPDLVYIDGRAEFHVEEWKRAQVPPHLKRGMEWLQSGCVGEIPHLLFVSHALQVLLYACAFSTLRKCSIKTVKIVYGCPQGTHAHIAELPSIPSDVLHRLFTNVFTDIDIVKSQVASQSTKVIEHAFWNQPRDIREMTMNPFFLTCDIKHCASKSDLPLQMSAGRARDGSNIVPVVGFLANAQTDAFSFYFTKANEWVVRKAPL